MHNMFQQRPHHSSASPAAAVGHHTVQCVIDDEDVVLGCESANPALQIERWGQEVALVTAATA